MKKKYIVISALGLFVLCLFLISNAKAQETQVRFDIVFKGNTIGALNATQTINGNRLFTELTSETDAKVLFFSFHLESDVAVEKQSGVLVSGTAFRESNHGPNDVQARVTKVGSYYETERNNAKDKIAVSEITFCVIDLYFDEPVKVREVFSNMYMQMLALKKIGRGKYRLMTPDNNNPVYIYRSGKLMRVELTTKLGDVISKRVGS